MACIFKSDSVQETRFHGIDWDGPLPDGDELESVQVPAIPVPLGDEDLEELQRTVCPTALSDDYGLDIYTHCLQFVRSKLFL